MPTVAAFHLISTAYGWWLPNDPRGSMSSEIRIESIADLGPSYYGRKTNLPPWHELRDFYDDAKPMLQHELLPFSDADIGVIAASFAKTIADERYTCYACALMDDHVHCLIRKHRDSAEDMLGKLQHIRRLH